MAGIDNVLQLTQNQLMDFPFLSYGVISWNCSNIQWFLWIHLSGWDLDPDANHVLYSNDSITTLNMKKLLNFKHHPCSKNHDSLLLCLMAALPSAYDMLAMTASVLLWCHWCILQSTMATSYFSDFNATPSRPYLMLCFDFVATTT